MRTQAFKDLQSILNTEPKTKSEKALKKWKEQGAFNLQELIESHKIEFEKHNEIKSLDFHGNKYDGQVNKKGEKCGIGRLVIYDHIHEGVWKDNK